MNYDVLYSNNKKQFNRPIRRRELFNMGNWRSRWERKRELDKNKGFYINKIYTRPTDKDYIFTKAYGYDSKSNMYFKIIPSTALPKPKNTSGRFNSAKFCNDRASNRYGKYCRYK